MFGLRLFLLGLLVGTSSGLFVTNYHVVNSAQGLVVVPRSQRPPLSSSYVDIRSWSQAMWVNHPEVSQALVADGRSELIRDNLKANLLDERSPEQTQTESQRQSRNVAGQPNVPILFESDRPEIANRSLPATHNSRRLLDSQSPMRQSFESAFDEAIAPVVEDDPDELASDPAAPVSSSHASTDAMVRQLEERFLRSTDSVPSTHPGAPPARTEAIPTSGDAKQMARDLLKQVIPTTGTLPRSAAPLRQWGRDLLSAPAPGQGSAASQPRVPAQSRVILSEPF